MPSTEEFACRHGACMVTLCLCNKCRNTSAKCSFCAPTPPLKDGWHNTIPRNFEPTHTQAKHTGGGGKGYLAQGHVCLRPQPDLSLRSIRKNNPEVRNPGSKEAAWVSSGLPKAMKLPYHGSATRAIFVCKLHQPMSP